MKKALVIGIDDYPSPNELFGCVNDAVAIAELLKTNGDGSPNFDIRMIISGESDVTTGKISRAINELFSGTAETVLLYFAGHGILNEKTNDGFLVTPDGGAPNWGVSLSSIMHQANSAYPRIKSTVILLDSCQSGFAGEISGIGKSDVNVIGAGVTILTACHKEGVAAEQGEHGKFTDIMLDGLGGAACDIIGRITPAALYSHVDQTLGAWEQRPIYKANVQSFITLRSVPPRVPREILRKLPAYFPEPSDIFKLDPSFEPDRGEEAKNLRNIPINEDNVKIYRELQLCNRNGLIVTIDHEHMWQAAVHSGSVKLSATGAHFRRLAERNKI